MQTTRENGKLILQSVAVFLKWVLIAGVVGAVGGLVGSTFHLSVEVATRLREQQPWLLFLLPVSGLAIVWLYHALKMSRVNTNAIIDSIHDGSRVPLALVPAIYLSTVITHLFGGSSGREGAALQIGGSLGNWVGRLFHLDEKDMRIVTLAGMSAVFFALFGTPLTASVFALEVISVGVIYYSALVPCLVAALVALQISVLFGAAPTRFALMAVPVSAPMVIRIMGLALLCTVLSIVLCLFMHGTEHLLAKHLRNEYLRIVCGGAAVVALSVMLGTRDYNGAGMELVRRAIEEGAARPEAFALKLLLTALTIGAGFKGGEVVPTFFIGATFGCVLGPLLGIPAGLAAAVGLVGVFCGAVNSPVASIFLSVELFGSANVVYFAMACGIAYALSGYFGLYSSQKIMYGKLRAEYINRSANSR